MNVVEGLVAALKAEHELLESLESQETMNNFNSRHDSNARAKAIIERLIKLAELSN